MEQQHSDDNVALVLVAINMHQDNPRNNGHKERRTLPDLTFVPASVGGKGHMRRCKTAVYDRVSYVQTGHQNRQQLIVENGRALGSMMMLLSNATASVLWHVCVLLIYLW